jgi:hypothetical protein
MERPLGEILRCGLLYPAFLFRVNSGQADCHAYKPNNPYHGAINHALPPFLVRYKEKPRHITPNPIAAKVFVLVRTDPTMNAALIFSSQSAIRLTIPILPHSIPIFFFSVHWRPGRSSRLCPARHPQPCLVGENIKNNSLYINHEIKNFSFNY